MLFMFPIMIVRMLQYEQHCYGNLNQCSLLEYFNVHFEFISGKPTILSQLAFQEIPILKPLWFSHARLKPH